MSRTLFLAAVAAFLSGCVADRSLQPTAVPSPFATSPSAFGSGSSTAVARQSLAQGDPTQAQNAIEQALRINPFDPVALNNLAVAKTEQGQFHEALDLLQRAAQLAPDNAEIGANLARLRAWSQSYAMVPLTSTVAGVPSGGANLPPQPPMLWSPSGGTP